MANGDSYDYGSDYRRGRDFGRADRDRQRLGWRGDWGGDSGMVNNDSLWGEYPNDPYYGSGAFDIDIRAGAGYTAPNHAGRGPRNYRRSDESIREDVNEHLTQNARLDATDIEVVVDNGEVTLNGEVADRHAKHLAEDIADEVSGVSDVHNHLKVRHGWMERIREAL